MIFQIHLFNHLTLIIAIQIFKGFIFTIKRFFIKQSQILKVEQSRFIIHVLII